MINYKELYIFFKGRKNRLILKLSERNLNSFYQKLNNSENIFIKIGNFNINKLEIKYTYEK